MKKDKSEDIIEKQKKQVNKIKSQLKNLKKTNSKLLSLIGVTSIIASSLDKKKVLKSILDQTKVLMECKGSSVLLVDSQTNQLYFEVLSNEEDMEALSEIRLEKGEGIAGKVWETGESLLIEDARKDERFSFKVDQKLEIETKSLIAVPLIVNNNVIGVMEVINKTDNTSFSKFDLDIFKILSIQAAIAIDNANLYEMAITDGLTKLFIHRYFKRRIKEEFIRTKRYNRDMALIMFDIDHFKNFNDTYGHQLGDEVLKKTASIIISNCRSADIPARYGGEEFALILPETDKIGGIDLAERIRKKIMETNVVFQDKIINITISAGVSSIKENNPDTPEELIEMSDKALYFSKENGRNKISLFNPDMKGKKKEEAL